MNAILAHSPCDECNGLLVVPAPFDGEGATYPCGLCSGYYAAPQITTLAMMSPQRWEYSAPDEDFDFYKNLDYEVM